MNAPLTYRTRTLTMLAGPRCVWHGLYPSSAAAAARRRMDRRERLTMATQAILVVNGHPTTRTVIAQALRDEGFATLEAPDGEEAVRLAQTHSPALVLPLAEPSTSLLLTRLKAVLPVVAISYTWTAPFCETEAYRGADGILEAPFHLADLVAEVRRGPVVRGTTSHPASAARSRVPTSPA